MCLNNLGFERIIGTRNPVPVGEAAEFEKNIWIVVGYSDEDVYLINLKGKQVVTNLKNITKSPYDVAFVM